MSDDDLWGYEDDGCELTDSDDGEFTAPCSLSLGWGAPSVRHKSPRTTPNR